MRTLTLTHSHHISTRIMHYVRLAFLSGASTAFFCHSSVAQEARPDHATSADDGSGKRFVYQYQNVQRSSASTVVYSSTGTSSGPSYSYNITGFVKNTLSVSSVVYSDNSATQLNNSAISLTETAHKLASEAAEARNHAKVAAQRWQAVALCKEADSLDMLVDANNLEFAKTSLNALESQYQANTTQIATYHQKTNYNSDLLTSAELLAKEAAYYCNLSVKFWTQADTSRRMYVKTDFASKAQKEMEIAVLKQQQAENIYLGMQNSNSIAVAEKIDSILITNEEIAKRETANSFGNMIFCVQVGSYSHVVPIDKANKLLKIAGLGITKHNEDNGVTTFTIGEYGSSSSTCADMLREELAEDGYTESTVITYQKGNDQPDTRWVIAKK